MTTAYERITNALSEVTGYTAPREGAEWKCPAHGDNSPSLSVTPKDDRVLIHCQGGCDRQAVLAALKLDDSDLFDKKHNGNGNGNGRGGGEGEFWTPYGEAVAIYRYTDESGYVLFEVCRTVGKDFPVRVPDSTKKSGYRWKWGEARRVPYRLPKVVEAVSQGWPVYIVEGEKDVHALEQAGEVATCNPGGAGKWKPEYAQWFEGADVIVVADKDKPGRQHARRVAESLEGTAHSVTIVEAIHGKDVSDHLAAGETVSSLWRVQPDEGLVESSPASDEPPPPDDDGYDDAPKPKSSKIRAFTRAVLDITKKPTPRPRVGKYLYRGGLTNAQSEAGVGKTWFALCEAIRVMNDGGIVLYFDEEGGEDLMRERLFALGASQEIIAERFFYFPFEARTWTDDDLEALRETISDAQTVGNVQLAVFDSLPDFLAAAGLSEDKAQDVTTFVNRVCGTLREAGIAQLMLDHIVKPQTGAKKERSRYARGSGAKLAKADASLLIEVAKEFDAETSGQLRVWKTKDRYGRLDVPRMSEPARLIDVIVDAGFVTMKEAAPSLHEPWQGPTECMNKLLDAITPGIEVSFRQIKGFSLGFRDDTLREALSRLVMTHQLTMRPGAKNSTLYSRGGTVQEALALDKEPPEESDEDVF